MLLAEFVADAAHGGDVPRGIAQLLAETRDLDVDRPAGHGVALLEPGVVVALDDRDELDELESGKNST